MTAEDPKHYFARARAYLEDAMAAHRLMATAIAGAEACLSAVEGTLALRDAEEAQRAAEGHTEADPPYLGWQPGDEIQIRTMGGQL